MPPDSPVKQQFDEQRELQQHCLPLLAETIEQAALLIVSRIIQGHRLLACGNGCGSALAQIFVAKLLHRCQYERPGLPALCLSADATTLTAIASEDSIDEAFARQITALGQPGDLLLLCSSRGDAINLMRAVQEAQEREMSCIALTGDQGELASLLGAGDIEIRVPSPIEPRIEELHLLILHCLCDLIDAQLLGH